MTKLTSQEIFDKALFGIRGQDYKQSGSGFGDCKYRHTDENDTKLCCAVGHCIDDDIAETWDSNLSDTSIRKVFRYYPSTFNQFFDESQLPLLSDLQAAHDQALDYGSLQWEGEMVNIAKKYNLNYTPV